MNHILQAETELERTKGTSLRAEIGRIWRIYLNYQPSIFYLQWWTIHQGLLVISSLAGLSQ
jgi:hypothetical protein